MAGKKILPGLVKVSGRPAATDGFALCLAHSTNRIASILRIRRRRATFAAVALTGELFGLSAPMQGTIVIIDVDAGQSVRAGQQVMLIESMKMHHAIEAEQSGVIDQILVTVGQTVNLEHCRQDPPW